MTRRRLSTSCSSRYCRAVLCLWLVALVAYCLLLATLAEGESIREFVDYFSGDPVSRKYQPLGAGHTVVPIATCCLHLHDLQAVLECKNATST
jgi:hypothetical protein